MEAMTIRWSWFPGAGQAIEFEDIRSSGFHSLDAPASERALKSVQHGRREVERMERRAHHAALRQSVEQRERDDAVAASGIENTKAWSKQRGAQRMRGCRTSPATAPISVSASS